MDDLPTYFDAIVVGTGMVESVLAAALSRIGKSVLHIDPNDYYGDNWASFNLKGFTDWTKKSTDSTLYIEPVNESFSNLITENEKILHLKGILPIMSLCHYGTALRKKPAPKNLIQEKTLQKNNAEDKTDKSSKSTVADIYTLSNKFILDVSPKLLFSKGKLVDLLITSNIAKYAEFKSVCRVLTWREGKLLPVPCSRSDVFATKNVSVVHKRILVKILTLFSNYSENLEEFKGFENKTFLEYLKYKELPEHLIHYILYAIAMGDNQTSCLDGVKKCKAFLDSLGRYGNTPFIFPLYGSGELPQCFCRLSAVFGGIYCLRREVEGLIIKNDECVGVISNNKRLNAKNVILSSKYAPEAYGTSFKRTSRGILITDRSILKGDNESLTLLQFPPIPGVSDKSVTVLELGSGTCTCPENYFVVHMTTETTDYAYSDLVHVVDELFFEEDGDDSRPKVLWCCYWDLKDVIPETNDFCHKNVKFCRTSDGELDYDCCIIEAESIFKELYPEEEFLPRAPDPDEIVLDVEETHGDGADISEKLRKPEDSSDKEPVSKNNDVIAEEQFKSDNISTVEETQTCDMGCSNKGEIQSADS